MAVIGGTARDLARDTTARLRAEIAASGLDRPALALRCGWFLLIPIAWLASKGTQPLLWGLVALSFWRLGWRVNWVRAGWECRWWAAVLALPLIAAATSPLSLDPEASLLRAVRLAVELVGFLALLLLTSRFDARERAGLLAAMMLGAAIVCAALMVDISTKGRITGPIIGFFNPGTGWDIVMYNRGATITAMFLPLMLLVGREPRWGIATAVAITACIMAVRGGVSTSANLALTLAVLTFLATWITPWAVRLAGIGAAVTVLAMPWVLQVQPMRPSVETAGLTVISTIHRAIIWDYTAARIAERPIAGWGMDASRMMPGRDERVVITGTWKTACDFGESRMEHSVLPLHPHSMALQLWLELGLGGAAAMAAMLALAGFAIGRVASDRTMRAALAATFVASFVVAMVSYGFWQGWWLNAMMLTAVATLLPSRLARPTHDDPQQTDKRFQSAP
jgi:O-antigen ligase